MLLFLESVDDHDFQGSSPSVARGDLPSRNVVVVVEEEERDGSGGAQQN